MRRISNRARRVIPCRRREDTAKATWAGFGANKRRSRWRTCIANSGSLRGAINPHLLNTAARPDFRGARCVLPRRQRDDTAKNRGSRGLPTGYAQSIHISTGPPAPSNCRGSRHVIPRRQRSNDTANQHGRAFVQTDGEIDGEAVLRIASCDATSGEKKKKGGEGLPAMRNQHTFLQHGPSPDFSGGQARLTVQATRRYGAGKMVGFGRNQTTRSMGNLYRQHRETATQQAADMDQKTTRGEPTGDAPDFKQGQACHTVQAAR